MPTPRAFTKESALISSVHVWYGAWRFWLGQEWPGVPERRTGCQRLAKELAKHGTVVLVGRDRGKLNEVQKTNADNPAALDLCDLTDHRPDSTRGRAPACAVLRQQVTSPDQDRKD
jgi:hypothetical protein